jgi:predicted nucleic-acid-binding protein
MFGMLESNQYLSELNMSDNFIPDEVFLHFIEILKRNKRIVKVDISRNQYTYHTLEKISILLRKNVEYQKEQKIPKIKQQMKDLLCNITLCDR